MLKRWLLYVGSVLVGLARGRRACSAPSCWRCFIPTLPSLETLTDYQPKIPLRIVSAEGDLLGEFGEERRAVVTIAEVPDVMKKAILAAEDERFYSHGGRLPQRPARGRKQLHESEHSRARAPSRCRSPGTSS